MRIEISLFLFLLVGQIGIAQQTESFESFDLKTGEFLNNAGPIQEFRTDLIRLPNNYNSEWDSWTGWSISTMTDVTTAGFTNQYSSIVGTGASGKTYATAFAGSEGAVLKFARDNERPVSVRISNSTYAYLSMLEGDAFAKRFGGEDGTDHDFFTLTIQGYLDGEPTPDAISVDLADFRFTDDSQDFILDEWLEVDLSLLGFCDYLLFTLESSDVGAFGINTPLYFCIDDLVMDAQVSFTEDLSDDVLSLFPNPVENLLEIKGLSRDRERIQLLDVSGALLGEYRMSYSGQIYVGSLPTGSYVLRFPERNQSRRFYKR